MSFISCAKWVKRGVAKSHPDKVELTKEELQKVINFTKGEIEDLEQDDGDESMEEDDESCGENEAPSSNEVDPYGFEEYDQEDLVPEQYTMDEIVEEDKVKISVRDDGDSEAEDDEIIESDNLVVVGRVEDLVSTLEIYVFNKEDDDLYVHHDIVLNSIPLCLEWLSYDSSESNPGNLIAVGSMSPIINVWDLDVMGCLEPSYSLGKYSDKKKHKKSNHGHTDAVLDIAWNSEYQHILASGSVDKTVLLWDLDTGKASTTFSEFEEKVQSIKWQPNNPHILLTGSADKTAKIFDCQSIQTTNKFCFNEEIEKVAWNPKDNNKMFFGTDGGSIISYDLRFDKQPLCEIKAHDKEISGLALDESRPDLLFTTSPDEFTKMWSIENDSIEFIRSKSFKIGEIHCLDLNPDCPHIACIGGSTKDNNFKVVDLLKQMLVKTEPIAVEADTNPVVFSEPSTSHLELTESALGSLSIKGKKIKSKKKIGHKFRKSN